jgi:5-methylcytosine-specific restriction enzyme subunit McrC
LAGTPIGWDLIVEFRIPIQNLYYLFCYAWNRLEESEAIDVGGTDSPELADLFAKVLIGGLKHLIRRGIDRGYVPVEEELSILRGRVNFQGSMQRTLRRNPQLLCEFDELRLDILTNQILKATALRLAKVAGLDKDLAHQVWVASRVLDVSDIRLSKNVFRQVQIFRNNAFYGFLIRPKAGRSLSLFGHPPRREKDGCAYRKPKSEHSGDEARRGSRVIRSSLSAE